VPGAQCERGPLLHADGPPLLQPRGRGPGERQVEVRVRPFGGGQAESRTVTFTVAKDFPEGPAFLLVGTAGSLNDSSSPADKFQALVAKDASGNRSRPSASRETDSR